MITVEEMMTHKPLTLSQYNSLADARQMMEENRFRHIPIVDENNMLVGLVTQRNVFANSISSQSFLEKDELASIEQGTLLADIMTREVKTVNRKMKIADAACLIHKYKFGCLPVVDNADRLVGIITDHDFVSITIQLLDMMDSEEPMELDDLE